MSSTTWHERRIVIAETSNGRGENSVVITRTQWQYSENTIQSFASAPYLFCANEVHARFMVVTTSKPSFLRSYQVLTASWFNYILSTFFLNMFKIWPRSARPFRSYYVLIGFYCVPTTLYKFLLRPPIYFVFFWK